MQSIKYPLDKRYLAAKKWQPVFGWEEKKAPIVQENYRLWVVWTISSIHTWRGCAVAYYKVSRSVGNYWRSATTSFLYLKIPLFGPMTKPSIAGRGCQTGWPDSSITPPRPNQHLQVYLYLYQNESTSGDPKVLEPFCHLETNKSHENLVRWFTSDNGTTVFIKTIQKSVNR